MVCLRGWYLEYLGGKTIYANGYVVGDPRFQDNDFITTSRVLDIVQEEEGYVVQTRNTQYFCRYDECDFESCVNMDGIANFEEVREKYESLAEEKLDEIIQLENANLYEWYIRKNEKERWIACGRITHHPCVEDSVFVNSSSIRGIEHIEDGIIINTRHTRYVCKYKDCDYSMESTYEMLANLEEIKRIYQEKESVPPLQDKSIWVQFSNAREYYFSNAYVKKDSQMERLSMIPHLGMTRDSVLIRTEYGDVDLRYFPSSKHLKFYHWRDEGKSVYFENVGDDEIYFTTPVGVIKLKPGEKKLIESAAAEKEENIPSLSESDLYSPGYFL